jgi:hypothetical protein
VFETGYLGREYGDSTPEAQRAVEVAGAWGLKLETTYTGKALACLLDRQSGPDPKGTGVDLFWNTHNGVDLSADAALVDDSELPPDIRAAVQRMIARCGRG